MSYAVEMSKANIYLVERMTEFACTAVFLCLVRGKRYVVGHQLTAIL